MFQRWVWNVLAVMMVVSAGQAVESQPALAGFQVVDSNQAVLDDALERAATPSQLGSSEQSHEDQEETTASELVRDDGVGYNPREFDRDLFEAGSRLPLDMSSLRMPWEGTFMIRQIFGMPQPAGWVRKRPLLPDIAGPDRPEAVQKGGKVIHAAVIERTKRLVHESDFELRQRALARWKAILDIWIREVLVSYGVHRDDVKVLASHSMKTTTLSWMAKWGANKLHRQLLGYHVPSLTVHDLATLRRRPSLQSRPWRNQWLL